MAITHKDLDSLMISDPSMAIDWGKISVANTTGILSTGNLTVTRTIDARKNLFASCIAAEARVSDLMMQKGDPKELFLEQKELLAEKVRHVIRTESKCSGCPNVTFRVDEGHDLYSGVRRIRVRASCGLDKASHTSVICPDGNVVSRAGGMATLVMEQPVDEIRENAKSAPEFPSTFQEPYIRIDPDKPKTEGGEAAW